MLVSRIVTSAPIDLPVMQPQVFSTKDLPQGRQLDAWRSWFDGLFDVSVDDASQGFAATSENWALGSFGLSRVAAPPLRAFRTPALVRRNPIDHWNIAIGHERTYGEVGRGRSIDVPARTPFVVSLGHELASARGGDTRLQMYLPRDAFYELAPALDGAIGASLDTPMGHLLADFLIALEQTLPELSEADLPGLQSAVTAMLRACVVPSPNNDAMAANQIAATRRERVRRIVNANLHDGALGPAMICQRAGISRSQLYRLFETDGGVVKFILSCRLSKAASLLSDPWNADPIHLVAYSLCFEDASQFSRAFKREFGASPSDVRHNALLFQGLNLRRKPDMVGEEQTLRHLLTRLA